MAYTGKNLWGDRKTGRGGLTSDDQNYFETQRRRISQQFNLGLAQNEYEKNTARSNYLRQRGQLESAWRNRFGGFQGDFAQGGLLNSGLYRQGYDRFRVARNMELGDLLAGYRDKVGALNLANQQLGSVRRNALDDVTSMTAARRATVAEELRRARQGL